MEVQCPMKELATNSTRHRRFPQEKVNILLQSPMEISRLLLIIVFLILGYSSGLAESSEYSIQIVPPENADNYDKGEITIKKKSIEDGVLRIYLDSKSKKNIFVSSVPSSTAFEGRDGGKGGMGATLSFDAHDYILVQPGSVISRCLKLGKIDSLKNYRSTTVNYWCSYDGQSFFLLGIHIENSNTQPKQR